MIFIPFDQPGCRAPFAHSVFSGPPCVRSALECATGGHQQQALCDLPLAFTLTRPEKFFFSFLSPALQRAGPSPSEQDPVHIPFGLPSKLWNCFSRKMLYSCGHSSSCILGRAVGSPLPSPLELQGMQRLPWRLCADLYIARRTAAVSACHQQRLHRVKASSVVQEIRNAAPDKVRPSEMSQ